MRYLVPFAALICAAGSLPAQDNPVAGQYIEDRSSRVYGCPCEWSSEYASSGREAVLAWSIESGEFAGEKLAGLRLAAVLVGDFNLSAPWALRRATLFVDETAPAPRRRAGEAWLRSRYGDMLGQVVGVHVVPIDFALSAETASLAIRDVLRLEMRRARFATDTQPWADLLYEPFTKLVSSTLGTALRTEYSGPDLAIRWARQDTAITGYYGRFALR